VTDVGDKIQKMSHTSKFSRQHPQIVTNFRSPISLSPQKFDYLMNLPDIPFTSAEAAQYKID